MLSFIIGSLCDFDEESIVLENGGIGYEITVPGNIIETLPKIGEKLKIYTFLSVKQDDIELFGFLTKDEREIFTMLISVNGIGPKSAVSILSGLPANELKWAILNGDIDALSMAKGVGKKTAKRIVLELKDKISAEDIIESELDRGCIKRNSKKDEFSSASECFEALIQLGYSSKDAKALVSSIDIDESMTTEEVLKLCLKKISFI